jgi:hypothetical protein
MMKATIGCFFFGDIGQLDQGCHTRRPKAIRRAGGWSCPLCLIRTESTRYIL